MAKQAAARSRNHAGRLRKLVVTSATAAALLPAVAHAERPENFGGGLFIGYRFGPSSQLEWGIEGFMMHRYAGLGCSTEPRWGVGPTLQIAWLGVPDFPRITLAAQLGGEVERGALSFLGELGATYRFGDETGFGIDAGAIAESFYVNTAFRYQALLNEAFIGGGVRVLPTFGEATFCESVVGRPLRSDDGRFVPQLAAFEPGKDEARPYASTRPARDRVTDVGLAFARDAQLERASVPAFLQLASELAAVGAPRALIAAALRSARDEVAHARLCAQLASEHLGREVHARAPEVMLRRPLRGPDAWTRLACESWLDGCLSEGTAAASAARAAALASDREASMLQRRIAVDEARHAELAWSVLDFALQRGGEHTREAVRALRDVTPAGASPEHVSKDLARFGRLGSDELACIAAARLEQSTGRLRACLG